MSCALKFHVTIKSFSPCQNFPVNYMLKNNVNFFMVLRNVVIGIKPLRRNLTYTLSPSVGLKACTIVYFDALENNNLPLTSSFLLKETHYTHVKIHHFTSGHYWSRFTCFTA